MKRITMLLLLTLILLTACARTMDNIADQPNFAGIVEEVKSNSILVRVNEDEEEMRSSDLISVSLDVEIEDSRRDFNIGDEVRVYYDGMIAESYPAQANNVYAIELVD